ncbi:MAG: hypothetical protein UW70_C0067G0003 [Candidatus Peregrinibacteria bacterium GW2011_GWA2_44_7]|nr:MAG: hypothetical protein UW70_C0067G0003 [Candidatus Peregrinibacteria bacterium GW2011_GWA2_44_7]
MKAASSDQNQKKKRPQGHTASVLDLSNLSSPAPKKAHKKILNDIQWPGSPHSNPEGSSHYGYQEYTPAQFPVANRFTEMMRMSALGILVVMVLNFGSVYSQGKSLRHDVVAASSEGVESITQSDSLNGTVLTNAALQFEEAEQSLWFLQSQGTALKQGTPSVESIPELLRAAQDLSSAAAGFMEFAVALKNPAQPLLSRQPVPRPSLTTPLLTSFEKHFQPAVLKVISANRVLQTAPLSVVPSTLQPELSRAKEEIAQLSELLILFNEAFPVMLQLLGSEHPQHYLVLLENNNELRPGGGFIGSYLLIDLNDGYLDELSFHDVYDVDGRFSEIIPPPEEIATLTDRWGLRDSNLSPDMSLSAQKAQWFLEKEGGPSTDHVITVDLETVRQLLAMIGPVAVEGLQKPLEADQFETVLSYIVESKLSGAESPKTIFNSFIPAVEAQLREGGEGFPLVGLISEMARQKHLALYSKQEDIQAFFERWGMAGKIVAPPANEDVLMVVSTSLGGNKSDAYLSQRVDHHTVLTQSGALLDTLTLTRQNNWSETEKEKVRELLGSYGFKAIDEEVMTILGAGTNVAGLRVYVPQGVSLQDVQGLSGTEVTVRHDEALGLDYFYFKSIVAPGEQQKITLTYELPFGSKNGMKEISSTTHGVCRSLKI